MTFDLGWPLKFAKLLTGCISYICGTSYNQSLYDIHPVSHIYIYASYGLDEWFRAMFEPTWTWPNFTFGQLFMFGLVCWSLTSLCHSNGTYRGPCQPEKLIPLLPWPGFDPSFSGHNDRRAITSEWTRLRLKPLSHRGWLVNFSCELGQIMTRYDFLWARWVILSNVRTDLNLT